MSSDLALVFDCGATNVRAVAVNTRGELIAQASKPNRPIPQPGGEPGWLVWDLDEIWSKMCQVAREVLASVEPERIEAVTVTTWGADGAPVRRDGSLTHPPISYWCPRTQGIAAEIVDKVPAWEIYKTTGYQVFSFNTLLRMIWLRQNVPRALDEAHTWLMMPGLLVFRLTGEFHVEPTSASTMMAMDLGRRDWSAPMLELAGLDPGLFPEWSEPGQVAGQITGRASEQCGLPAGIPVIVGGHDTQFAFIGSGAHPEEAILSSGTWELLARRVDRFRPNRFGFEEGMSIEADALPGFWDPQMIMIGSAVIEWIRKQFFAELSDLEYGAMIEEGSRVQPGSDGVTLVPSFVRDTGPTRKFGTLGTLLGLTTRVTRGHIYRAALEGLSFQLRDALRILTKATRFKVQGIRVVGGGSRNDLWNQIRADVTDLPITVTAQKEAAVIGAALMAFVGIGRYSSFQEAQKAFRFDERCFAPSDVALYDELFDRYTEVPHALMDFYRQ